MGMNVVENLTKHQYEDGAAMAFENANRLLESSASVAQIEHYGTATSLLILAFEELAKATVLKLKSLSETEISIQNLKKYFRCHPTKQQSIRKMVPAIFSAKLSQAISEDTSSANIWGVNRVVLIIALAVVYWNSKVSGNSGLDQTEDLDKIKKFGFYVEFDIKTQCWVSPKREFSLEVFEKVKREVETAFRIIDEGMFKNVLSIDEVNQLKEALKKENLIL